MPIYPNLLARRFAATQPNAAWVTDLTYSWTQAGWRYLGVILELFSRRAAGGRPGDHNGARPHQSERRF